jgi:hypothetical protein
MKLECVLLDCEGGFSSYVPPQHMSMQFWRLGSGEDSLGSSMALPYRVRIDWVDLENL